MSFDPKGYVSFETALSLHGVLDHLVHDVRIASARGDLEAVVPGIGRVEWIDLPDDLLYGFAPGTELDFPGWNVAEPEKALCDLLWLCESRGFAIPVESLRLDDLHRDRLEAHAARMGLDLGRIAGARARGAVTP